jgi:hypothetical protein
VWVAVRAQLQRAFLSDRRQDRLCESINLPLMVIFEDLHWIDEQTQALLNLLGDSIGTAKILLLVNYRPEYSHPWGSKTYYTQLRLDPLSKESADEVLLALLGDGRDLEALKRVIIEKTEGNPFFMEETVRGPGAPVRPEPPPPSDRDSERLHRPPQRLFRAGGLKRRRVGHSPWAASSPNRSSYNRKVTTSGSNVQDLLCHFMIPITYGTPPSSLLPGRC